MAKWFLKKTDVNIDAMSKALQISHVLSAVLANRGIKTKSAALKFLNPKREEMYNTAELKDIDKAVALIVDAVAGNKRIAVYGDYDVDGVMSASILYRALKKYNADVVFYIPHREEEGYGMNISAVDKLHNKGVGLIITCDNGIAAIEEIKYAKNIGMEVIVIDHHEPGFSVDKEGKRTDIIPNAAAVIDPKQACCNYPFKSMCAAGITYKFVKYFYEYVKIDLDCEDEFLILASIATVCDIVDLVEENRIIVKYGLELINTDHNTNIGLKALIRERQIDSKKVSTFDIGFIIGPCINASGRLETAAIAAQLFTCEDEALAEELASKLVRLNDERKALTSKAVESAIAAMKEKELDKVIVLYDADIHESIAGIVAGRIKDMFYRPAIVLTNSLDFAKGSARSIEGYNIFEELYKCKDLFEKFGGHEMAAGLSIKHENIAVLRERLNESCQLQESDFVQTIRIDKEIPISEVTFERANELKILEPFGKQNKEPIFGTKNLTACLVETIGENKKTLRFTFTVEETGRKIKAVCFNKLEQFVEMLGAKYGENALNKFKYGRIANIRLDILYCVEVSEYNGNTYVNMRIIDFRI